MDLYYLSITLVWAYHIIIGSSMGTHTILVSVSNENFANRYNKLLQNFAQKAFVDTENSLVTFRL